MFGGALQVPPYLAEKPFGGSPDYILLGYTPVGMLEFVGHEL